MRDDLTSEEFKAGLSGSLNNFPVEMMMLYGEAFHPRPDFSSHKYLGLGNTTLPFVVVFLENLLRQS